MAPTPARGKKSKNAKSGARKQYSAPALEKGLDILELLADESEGINLSEIAIKLGRSVGEVFRMIAVLEQREYLKLDDNSDKYALTFKMFDLSHRHAPIKLLTTAAIPVMRKLTRNIQQSCHLAVHYQGRGLIIAQKESPGASGFNVRLGAEFQLLQNCSGHVLLAFSEKERRLQIYNEISPAQRKKMPKTELGKITDRVQRQGFECMNSTVTYGMKDIGYPIYNHHAEVVAALTVPFLERIDGSQKTPLEGAQKQLSAAATAISTAMGYTSK